MIKKARRSSQYTPLSLGVVGIDGMPERALARASVTAADRERMREIERTRKNNSFTAMLGTVL
jgi:hypothetical protein